MFGLFSGSLVKEKMFGRGVGRAQGRRSAPDRIVLEPKAGVAPSPLAAVRIFVGTEPGQYRAERVFVYSVERVRDPARRYEIHLMRDLEGFDRSRWLTGFTNYRFAIPHFAGNAGRAIYNDVDQIYLDDPAALLDIEMGEHGFLALSDKDTAVMVMDCARMGKVWRIDEVRRERRKAIEAKARAVPGLWGPLPAAWHCRDEEYRQGWSRLLHYTTIHSQPWQPFPEVFAYQPNAVGHVWLELERQARLAGVHVFRAEQPSPRFLAMRETRRDRAADRAAPKVSGELAVTLREETVTSIVEYSLQGVAAGSDLAAAAGGDAQAASLLDLGATPNVALPARRWHLVVCRRDLELLPREDVAWVIDALFERAAVALHLEVSTTDALVHDGEDGARSEGWWSDIVSESAARHPGVRWSLVAGAAPPARVRVRRGGPRAGGQPPRVWILADHKLGHTTQSVGLAAALGFPYEIKQLAFNRLEALDNRILGASLSSLDRSRSQPLEPPWPELVIATGRTVSPVARWIGRRSQGRTRIVQMGRRGVHPRADAFDLSVVCGFFGCPVHPRRMETLAPLTAIDDARLSQARQRWDGMFAGEPAPHVALLVGGSSAVHSIDAETASRMAADVCAWTRANGGSLYIITSPRTGAEAAAALRNAVEREAGHVRLYEWKRGDGANPYMGALAVADVLVVTADSESMLAEAAATDRPLYIYPVPRVEGGPIRKLRAGIVARATRKVRKAKGTVRPQQGLEYACARLIESGVVRPPRNIAELHRGLIEGGHARAFGEPMDLSRRTPLRELPAVADRVRALLGLPPVASGGSVRSDSATGDVGCVTSGVPPEQSSGDEARCAGDCLRSDPVTAVRSNGERA